MKIKTTMNQMEEIEGLDSTEHGLTSAYPDFVTSFNEKKSM